jgi:phage repressor protein C with HTH and peptisase S24 domain
VALVGGVPRSAMRTMPMISFVEASEADHFDERGFPGGDGWDEFGFAAVEDRHAFALEISGDALRPALRDGTFIIVSPASAIRRGDRVVIKIRSGEVIAKELTRKTSKAIELNSLNPAQPDRPLANEDYL